METNYILHRICTLLFMMGEFTSFSQNSVRESAHWTKLFVSEMTNLNASDWPSLKLKTQRKRVRLFTFLSCLVFLRAHGFGHVCLLWAFLSCLVCLCEHMAFVCFCQSLVLTQRPVLLLPDYWLICPTCSPWFPFWFPSLFILPYFFGLC